MIREVCNMKGLKGIVIFFLITGVIFACSPPPELPDKEEMVKNVKFKGSYSRDDVDYFLKFFNEMRESVKNEDAEKSFSFYSRDFMSDSGINLNDLKKNTELLYKAYDNIVYSVSDVQVHVKADKAVTTDNYFYKAGPAEEGYKPLNYKGRERIYWQKEKENWKIINWIYE